MPSDDTANTADSELLRAVAAADRTAFERLYRLYEKRVYRYALTFVRDRSSAEEVTVDTLSAVWNGAAGFSGDSRVSTWILGIARHKALDVVRKSARQSRGTSLEAAAEIADPGAGAAESLSGSESGKLVRAAMATMTADHQEILRLVFFEELPYEEIASLLAIPANTVKTRVFYAKQQLRQRLDGLASQGAV